MPRVKPNVKLLQYTGNPEQTVALAAKLCYSDATIDKLADGVNDETAAKFLSRLMGMGHQSPIEHASFTFGIEGVSRALLAQITRHRVASFSVKSQRYVSAKENFNYVIPPAIENLGDDAVKEYESQMAQMQKWYGEWQEKLGGKGEKTNEDARFVLPNASETKMIVTMNARELFHFFSLRCCFRAQWEIREVAWQMLKLVSDVAPNLFASAGPNCYCGGCTEGTKSCGRQAEVKEIRNGLNK